MSINNIMSKMGMFYTQFATSYKKLMQFLILSIFMCEMLIDLVCRGIIYNLLVAIKCCYLVSSLRPISWHKCTSSTYHQSQVLKLFRRIN